jgi:hypothetical protein
LGEEDEGEHEAGSSTNTLGMRKRADGGWDAIDRDGNVVEPPSRPSLVQEMAQPSTVVPFRRPIPGGASPETVLSIPAALRKLADQFEAGEFPMPELLICIPANDEGTDLPHLLTPRKVSGAELVGRLELCKLGVADWMAFGDDEP